MRLPSVKALIQNHFADTSAQARAIREALTSRLHKTANRLMETHGVETICWPEGAFSNCEAPDHTLEYFNAGDTYSATVLRIDGGAWFIGCWGDTYEAMTRRFGNGGAR